MYSGHLSCPGCRIRVRACAPEIELLEGRCPICGSTLKAVSSASAVMGFRSFDLEALSGAELSDRLDIAAQPSDLAARREAAYSRDDFDADRWSDECGSIRNSAAALRPAAR